MSARRLRRVLVALSGLVLGGVGARAASAQVIYEPVRYQYGAGVEQFYYGGHDPLLFQHVGADIARTTYESRVTWTPATPRPRIYSDVVPLQNVGSHEYTSYSTFTIDDARNEAYANVPRYFRKRDLLRSRDNYVTEPEAGAPALVVPAYAEPRIEIRVVRPFGVTTAPAVQRGGILIIPKKVDPKQDRSVAMVGK